MHDFGEISLVRARAAEGFDVFRTVAGFFLIDLA
jgi:hypothetical protein